jgi:hypothetical protein
MQWTLCEESLWEVDALIFNFASRILMDYEPNERTLSIAEESSSDSIQSRMVSE